MDRLSNLAHSRARGRGSTLKARQDVAKCLNAARARYLRLRAAVRHESGLPGRHVREKGKMRIISTAFTSRRFHSLKRLEKEGLK